MIPGYHGSIAVKKSLFGQRYRAVTGLGVRGYRRWESGVAVFSVAARGSERHGMYGMKDQHEKRSSIIGTVFVAL